MIQDTSAQDTIVEREATPLWRKPWMLAPVAILLLAAAYPTVATWSSADASVNLSRVRVASVERGTFTRDVAMQGNIVAANSPSLYAPAIGTVTLIANPGQNVKEGELLAKIESPQLTNQLQRELAKLESLRIELDRQRIASKQSKIKSRQQTQLEKVALDAAKREKRRAEQSVKRQAISQFDYEKAIDDFKRSQLKFDFAVEQAALEKEILQFELKTRESEVSQYSLEVDNTQRLVAELDIVAPVSGVVGSWSVEQKAAVAVNQALLTVVDLSALEVEVDIPESYSDELGIGMAVKVTYNSRQYDAAISSISPEVSGGVVKGRVTFTDTPPAGIKQNQRVSSKALLEQKDNVLYLPRGSFVQHYGGMKAFVVEDGVATLKDIVLGSSSIGKIEVLSGLKEGERIIISNTDFVEDAKVLVLN